MDFRELNWGVRNHMDIVITPQIARHWLDHHNHNNRAKGAFAAAKYSRDMEAGRWEETGETISFDWFGELINGQTRLEAIWSSQRPQMFIVVTGLPPSIRPVIDAHRKRSVADAFSTSGRSDLISGGSIPANTGAGMWARIMHGIKNTKGGATNEELLAFADLYPEGGGFAIREFGKHRRIRSISVAPVMAAVANAYYHYPQSLSRLENFVKVLTSGMQSHPDDKVIIVLREALNGNRAQHDKPKNKRKLEATNSNAQSEIYGKTARTIQAYMRGEMLNRIYEPAQEPFPLPVRKSTATPTLAHRMAGDGRQQPRESGTGLLA